MLKYWLALLLFCVLCFFCFSNLYAGFPVPFQADYIDSNEEGEVTKGKFFAGSEGVRLESTDGEQYIMIVNFAESVSWTFLVEEKMYYEMPLTPQDIEMYTSPCEDEDTVSKTMVGRETLQGRDVEKWHCVMQDGDMEKVWFDPRLKTLIRSESEGNIFELSNIREGRVSSDLFQLPAGYTKITLPGIGFGGADYPGQQDQEGVPGGFLQDMDLDELMGGEDQGLLEGLKGILGR